MKLRRSDHAVAIELGLALGGTWRVLIAAEVKKGKADLRAASSR